MENWKNTNINDLYYESWKDVVGYNGLYKVSNMGRVKSIGGYFKSKGVIILKQGLDRYGYCQVVLMNDGNRKTHKVHRLVMTAFCINIDNKPTINHKQGVKTDNRVSELEWVTVKENVVHSYEILGRKGNPANAGKFGVLNWNSKKVAQIDLSTNDIIATYYGTQEAGRFLGISRKGIGRCALGLRNTYKGYKWKYI